MTVMDTRTLTQKQVDAWVGTTVRTIMQSQLMSTHDLARRVGMTDATLRNRMRGDRSWTPKELIDIAKVLGVDEGELLNGWGGKVPVPAHGDAPFPRLVDSDRTGHVTRQDRPARRITAGSWPFRHITHLKVA